jgi:hypothetical protein
LGPLLGGITLPRLLLLRLVGPGVAHPAESGEKT